MNAKARFQFCAVEFSHFVDDWLTCARVHVLLNGFVDAGRTRSTE